MRVPSIRSRTFVVFRNALKFLTPREKTALYSCLEAWEECKYAIKAQLYGTPVRDFRSQWAKYDHVCLACITQDHGRMSYHLKILDVSKTGPEALMADIPLFTGCRFITVRKKGTRQAVVCFKGSQYLLSILPADSKYRSSNFRRLLKLICGIWKLRADQPDTKAVDDAVRRILRGGVLETRRTPRRRRVNNATFVVRRGINNATFIRHHHHQSHHSTNRDIRGRPGIATSSSSSSSSTLVGTAGRRQTRGRPGRRRITSVAPSPPPPRTRRVPPVRIETSSSSSSSSTTINANRTARKVPSASTPQSATRLAPTRTTSSTSSSSSSTLLARGPAAVSPRRYPITSTPIHHQVATGPSPRNSALTLVTSPIRRSVSISPRRLPFLPSPIIVRKPNSSTSSSTSSSDTSVKVTQQ